MPLILQKTIGKTDWAILLILLLAAVARFWGISFGLPNAGCRPDENFVVKVALRFGSGDLNPHFFWYPSLYYYPLFGFYVLYYLLGSITGRFTSPEDLIAEYALDPTVLYMISRIFSALLGLATVFIAYKLGERIAGRRVGIISALFLALAYLHVRESHFGTVDVAMTFATAWAMFLLIRCYETKTMKSYLLAGLMTGLATSLKYNAVLLWAPFGLMHFLNGVEEKKSWRSRILDSRPLLFGLIFGAAFIAGTPFSVLDYRTFIREITSLLDYMQQGHVLLQERGWLYDLRFSLWIGLGGTLLLASLLGLMVTAASRNRKALIICSFPVVYYLVACRGASPFVRYTLPMVPFLCISGALFVDWAAPRMTRLLKWKKSDAMAYLLSVLLILPSTWNIIRFDSLLARDDNRLVAARWVNENIPEGASVFQSGSGNWAKLLLLPTQATLRVGESEEDRNRMDRAINKFVERHGGHGYDLWEFDEERREFMGAGRSQSPWPDYIILQKTPLEAHDRLEPDVAILVDSCYQELHRFEVIELNDTRNIFDPLDAFFMPYAGFHNVQRPGPNVYVYRKLAGKDPFRLPERPEGWRIKAKKLPGYWEPMHQ